MKHFLPIVITLALVSIVNIYADIVVDNNVFLTSSPLTDGITFSEDLPFGNEAEDVDVISLPSAIVFSTDDDDDGDVDPEDNNYSGYADDDPAKIQDDYGVIYYDGNYYSSSTSASDNDEVPVVSYGNDDVTTTIIFDGSASDGSDAGYFFSSPFFAGPESVDSHSATDGSVAAAENALFQTPHREEYEEIVHEVVSAVKDNCRQDYETFCAPLPDFSPFANSILSLFSSNILASLMSPSPSLRRKLGSVDTLVQRAHDHFDSIKHRMGPQLDAMASKFAHFRDHFKLQGTSSVGRAVSGASDNDASPWTPPKDDLPPLPPPKGRPFPSSGTLRPMIQYGSISPVTQKQLRGNMRILNEHDHHHEDHHHDHDHEEHEHDHEGHHHDHDEYDEPCGGHHDGPQPPAGEDLSYSGELLWGADGDNCMYSYFDSLSSECQDSIMRVYEVRNQYWAEEEDAHHPHVFPFFIAMTFLILIALIAKKSYRMKRYQKELAIYNALQANPELKAQVESAAGVTIDVPRERKCSASKCCFFFLRALFSFVLGCIIVHISLFVTILVVENMITYDDNGNEQLPSPFVPLCIFLLTLSGLSILVMLLIATVQKLYTCNGVEFPTNNDNNNSTSRPTKTSSVLSYLRLPAWPLFNNSAVANTPAGYDVLPLESTSTHSNAGSREMILLQQPSAPRTVVLTNYPSLASCVTPVNII